jgi:predicted unusual protein kinase regulating ubiquinone biosynthesis (AarF/ABC1/UbiB family)
MPDQASEASIPTGRLRRVVPLAGMAARSAGDSVLAALQGRRSDPERYVRRAERYVELLGRSKGALMKMGQVLSFVPFGAGLSPENREVFQAAMARLQADAPPMAPELVGEVISAELGGLPSEVFAEFSAEPIAAASIGQVHRARLGDGREVAVKVQYPGVADAIADDLANTELMAVFFQLLRSVIPGIAKGDPRKAAADVAARITEELDYTREATDQAAFAEFYRGHPFIRIPEIVPERSTRRVLTQEYLDGVDLRAAMEADQALRSRWAEVLFRFYYSNIRDLGLMNADPHPGNYLFRADGSVAFLDFGSVIRLAPGESDRVFAMVRAAIRQDAGALMAALVAENVFWAGDRIDPADVLAWYSALFEGITGPQPMRMSPDFSRRSVEYYSPTGPFGKVIRSLRTPDDAVFKERIDLGVRAVMAELRPIADWRAIVAEYIEGAEPSTEAGVSHWAWRDGRLASK